MTMRGRMGPVAGPRSGSARCGRSNANYYRDPAVTTPAQVVDKGTCLYKHRPHSTMLLALSMAPAQGARSRESQRPSGNWNQHHSPLVDG